MHTALVGYYYYKVIYIVGNWHAEAVEEFEEELLFIYNKRANWPLTML